MGSIALTGSFLLRVEYRQKKFQQRLIGERVLTRDQFAILKNVARPRRGYADVTACGTQGEVRVKQNFAANFHRLALLLFRRRKDGHLVSGINPAFGAAPASPAESALTNSTEFGSAESSEIGPWHSTAVGFDV